MIGDFEDGDLIVVDAGLGVASAAEVLSLARSADGGDDVVIDFGGGAVLRLEDVSLASLGTGDFAIG